MSCKADNIYFCPFWIPTILNWITICIQKRRAERRNIFLNNTNDTSAKLSSLYNIKYSTNSLVYVPYYILQKHGWLKLLRMNLPSQRNWRLNQDIAMSAFLCVIALCIDFNSEFLYFHVFIAVNGRFSMPVRMSVSFTNWIVNHAVVFTIPCIHLNPGGVSVIEGGWSRTN